MTDDAHTLHPSLAPFQEGGKWHGLQLNMFPGLASDIMNVELALVDCTHRYVKLADAVERFVKVDSQLGNLTARQMRRREAVELVKERALLRSKLRTLIRIPRQDGFLQETVRT